MLRGLHKASSTWLGKLVMAVVVLFLVGAFAIWGINDIFRGFGQNEVATVGGTEISTDRFRQFYNDRLQELSQQQRRPIPPDEVRARHLDQIFLGQMIVEVTLDEQARRLGLGLGNDTVVNHITNDPMFRGPTGQFDRQRFEFVLDRMRYSEARFVAEQRKQMLRRQIALSISGDLHVPASALEAINQFRNETRNMDYVLLGPAQAGDVPAPSAEQLSQYFEERKALFRAPEYRKVTLLALTGDALAKPADVSDADAKTFFEQHKGDFGKPEKREVRQMVFAKPEEAAAAREKIAKGASFDDIVKERGLKPTDTDLGLLTKAQIINPAVADAAFALKSGEVSQPVQGTFGTALLTIGKIEPGEEKKFEDLAAQIKKEIAATRARSKISELRDKIEDEKASGATLAETAKKLGLTVQVIDAVDRAGNGPDGKPIANLPAGANIAQAAFSTDVGVDNEALQVANGFVYFELNGVTPSRERTLDEVKDRVETSWRNDEIAKRLKAKSDELMAKLKAGTSLDDVAKEAGVAVQKATDLKRGKAAGFVPVSVVEAAFKTAKDMPTVAEGAGNTETYIFRVTAVTDPKLDATSPEAKQITTALQNAYADDVTGEYLARLENEIGISINQAAVNQVIGGGTGEPGN